VLADGQDSAAAVDGVGVDAAGVGVPPELPVEVDEEVLEAPQAARPRSTRAAAPQRRPRRSGRDREPAGDDREFMRATLSQRPPGRGAPGREGRARPVAYPRRVLTRALIWSRVAVVAVAYTPT